MSSIVPELDKTPVVARLYCLPKRIAGDEGDNLCLGRGQLGKEPRSRPCRLDKYGRNDSMTSVVVHYRCKWREKNKFERHRPESGVNIILGPSHLTLKHDRISSDGFHHWEYIDNKWTNTYINSVMQRGNLFLYSWGKAFKFVKYLNVNGIHRHTFQWIMLSSSTE